MNQFELHALSSLAETREPRGGERAGFAEVMPGDLVGDGADLDGLPWQEGQGTAWHLPLAIAEGDGDVFVAADSATGELARVEHEGDAHAAFRVVRRRLGASLAMLPARDGVTVNGLPSLPLAILSPRDLVVLAPGCHSYVTERVRLHVGSPTPEMLGKKCPYCRVPIDKDTRVVSHRCGAVYHHETAESHPNVADDDRLKCFSEIRACVSCNRPVTLEEFLVWDPATLGA